MPTISMFFGILVRMYYNDTDKHKEPHIHVKYAEYEAVYAFNGEILSGKLPSTQAAYVKAWTLLHADELRANWELCIAGEDAFKIEPLR